MEDQSGLTGTSSFKNRSEDGRGRVLPFPGDDELEKRLGFHEHFVGAEKVDHSAVRVNGEAKVWLGG